MTKSQLKDIVSKKIITLLGEWFNDKPLIQAFAITAVQTNINKFDSIINIITDENGDVNVNQLVENLGEYLKKDYNIDLTTISPLLPRRILIISKQDIKSLVDELLTTQKV